MRRKSNISKRCMVCIMSAMMMMSSVTGTMIAPIGAYAENYNRTAEIPEDTDGHRNLASEDTLDVNNGTIHENRGTIRENIGTVEDNANGTVVSNSGTVNWGNVTTNESSGTVVAATVTDNYGKAQEDSVVTNNYAIAENSTVTDNWASGTVSGTSLVTNNHGGRIDGNDVTVTHDLGTDPGPNPPVSEVKPINNPTDTISEVQSDTPKPEETNDLPQAPAPTNIVGVKEIENAITTQLNNMPADSTNGEIMLEFGTNTNIDADMLYSLLTYTPEGRTSVNEPIFCSFKIDGVTYYLRIDRGTQISAEQIKAFFANNKSEGPMQIAQWFGNYGVSLVPGADAIKAHMELVTKELEVISESNSNELIHETVGDIYHTGVEGYVEIMKHDSSFSVLELHTLSELIVKIQNCTNEADLDEVLKNAQDILDRGKYAEEAINYLNQKKFEIFNTCGNILDDLKKNRDEIAKNLIAVEAELQAAKTGSIDTDVDAVKDLEKEFADLQGMLQNIDKKLEDSYVTLLYGMENLALTEDIVDKYCGGIDNFTPGLPDLYSLEKELSKAAADRRKAILESKAETTAITNANAAIAPVNNTADIARGREIFYDPVSGSWFWLDVDANGAMAGDKEVFVPYIYQNERDWDEATMRKIANRSDPGMRELVYQDMKNRKGKWVRYGADGKMLKGWITIEGDLAEKYPKQVGNTYYYDTVTGTMARGYITIDGVTYHFNESTGVLE